MESENTVALHPMTVDKITVQTGLSRTFIWEEIRAGKLVSYRVGRRVMVLPEDLNAWIKSHKRNCE
jgi:excisionase family DNA binding protein